MKPKPKLSHFVAKRTHRITDTCLIQTCLHYYLTRFVLILTATTRVPDQLRQTYVSDIRKSMPDLPPETRARLLAQGLSERDADVLMAIDMGREVGYDGVLGHGAVSYFDTVARGRDPKTVVNWYVLSVPCDSLDG